MRALFALLAAVGTGTLFLTALAYAEPAPKQILIDAPQRPTMRLYELCPTVRRNIPIIGERDT